MKCRNWRTEDPERPENPEEPEEPENPEDPERSGISGSLRKRPVRATPENPEPPKIPSASSPARKYMLFAPKPQALRRFICPATAHLRTKCRTPLRCGPQNTPAPHRKSVSLRFPPEQAEGRSGTSGTPGTGPQGPLRPRRTPSGSPRAQHIHHLQSHILHFKALYTYFNYK